MSTICLLLMIKNKISTEKINSILKKYKDGRYEFPKFIDEYNGYMESVKDFESFIKKKKKRKTRCYYT